MNGGFVNLSTVVKRGSSVSNVPIDNVREVGRGHLDE